MKTIIGIGASDHVAIEKIHYLEQADYHVDQKMNCNKTDEMKSFIETKDKAIEELKVLHEKAKIQNEKTAEVFEIHQMLLDDLDFVEGVESLLDKGYNAEYAVEQTGDKFKRIFEASDNEILQARAMDVLDVTRRMIRIFKGIEEEKHVPDGKFILISQDLYPSDIVKFDTEHIAGFVTKFGSKNSHAAILARTLNLPIVVHLGDRFDEIPHYGVLAINGATGEVVINPNKYILDIYSKKLNDEKELLSELEKYRHKEAISPDGHKVIVAANIGNITDTELVIKHDADGVGLFRSEFIYLERNDYPSEDVQFKIYKEVVEKLSPKQVIVRTLDIGADKTVDYFKLAHEENPALGYRAIRICLKNVDLFKAQLRALLRASTYGNLAIMIPMITHLEQVLETKRIILEVKEELKTEGKAFRDDIKVGIMIETPAAVMIAEELAKEVDFFSIGTNDLTQYTLAVDRMNTEIEQLFDSRHPAVLKMIEITAKAAHDAGIWVGICGESASDLSLIDFYMKHKIDELSVSPGKVLRVKKAIIESKKEE